MALHVYFSIQDLRKIIAILTVVVMPATCVAQQTCAQIPPPDLRSIDRPLVVYSHYIEPIQNSLSVGKALVLPNDVTGKVKLLASLQQGYMTYDEATAIDLVQTIKLLYANADLKTLNTSVVLHTLKNQKNDRVADRLINTAMCAAPSPQSPASKFDISFYALNEKACKKIRQLFSPSTSPTEVRVNNVVNDKCQPDGFGTNGARNQLTFTYLKG